MRYFFACLLPDRSGPLRRKITSDIRGGAVFSLPWLVARDEGLFAAENLDVEFVRSPKHEPKLQPLARPIRDHDRVNSTDVHLLFEQGQAQFHRGCEWGQIRRAYDSNCGGLIVSKRAAVVSQAILVRPDSPYVRPQDLRNVPVAVHFHAGSHYLTLQILEGFLSRDEIKVLHIPVNAHRYQALLDRVVDAITIAEPWISLTQKQSCKLISEAYCVGSEVASPDIDPETYAAINRAIKKAVHLINADKKKYLHYFIADIPPELGSLVPEDFYLPRLRYVDPIPYPADEFERAYQWMLSWNLIEPDAAFDRIVDNRITVGPELVSLLQAGQRINPDGNSQKR
jgi:NitT/TauT family transport system substrate-binding protein